MTTCRDPKDPATGDAPAATPAGRLFRWFAEHTGDYLTPGDGLPSSTFYQDKARDQEHQICSRCFCHDSRPSGFVAATTLSASVEEDSE